ncbi:hypothetical protein N7530_008031 [Penicillium desertorum]|uniref:Uncharacterized protein n=1 Tax=Penicillium desertorum TaxID=1303715 RepID=A0A9W9WNC4_9EURO|nr:hypothetical protein N7530_008031 [Penicillium desertorum]
MDHAFTIPRCRQYEANDIKYLTFNVNSSGPPSEPELLHAAGVLLREPIRDFFATGTKHRQV